MREFFASWGHWATTDPAGFWAFVSGTVGVVWSAVQQVTKQTRDAATKVDQTKKGGR